MNIKNTNVENVTITVTNVKEPLITVLPVIHQESVFQTVSVQMDSMITVTLVSDVPITVILVITDKNVKLVPILEKKPQLVNVQKDSTILVKKNVKNAEKNAKPVITITSVLLVLTHPKDNHHLVIVQLVGKILQTVSIVLKCHIQMVYLT